MLATEYMSREALRIEVATLRRALRAANKRIDRLREVLRNHAWCQYQDGRAYCVHCRAWKPLHGRECILAGEVER